jgi:ketosteroid isomerase-like protein
VGYEHNQVNVDGQPRYTLRVTHTHRREGGEWRIVHRHADTPPADDNQAPLLMDRAGTTAP